MADKEEKLKTTVREINHSSWSSAAAAESGGEFRPNSNYQIYSMMHFTASLAGSNSLRCTLPSNYALLDQCHTDGRGGNKIQ